MLYVNQCIGYHLQFHVLSHDMYNAQDSDSEGESADDIEVTMVTTCESERHRSLRNLDLQDYQRIMSPHGWLDGVIIHSAQVLL